MFTFRLQALLTLKQRGEDTAKGLYAEEIKRAAHEGEVLVDLERELERCYGARNDLSQFYLTEERISFLKKEIIKQKERIAHQEKKVHEALKWFIEKKKEKEIILKLREKDEAEYKSKMKKMEFKKQDYLYTSHFGNREVEE